MSYSSTLNGIAVARSALRTADHQHALVALLSGKPEAVPEICTSLLVEWSGVAFRMWKTAISGNVDKS